MRRAKVKEIIYKTEETRERSMAAVISLTNFNRNYQFTVRNLIASNQQKNNYNNFVISGLEN